MSDREARLQRFVQAYKRNGGKADEAVIEAGDHLGVPLLNPKRAILDYFSQKFLAEAREKGLIVDGKRYPKVKDKMAAEELLDLLTKQASGERPTYRQEVLRRNPETGSMEVVEIRSTFDEVKSQEILAKILGLYEEVPKGPDVNIGVMIDGLKGWDKDKAEALLMEAHMKMLGAPEIIDVIPEEKSEAL
jgi:hypothetical protein